MSFTIPTNVVHIKPATDPIGVMDVQRNTPNALDTSEDNKFIAEELIPTARVWIETLACRSLITQTRKQYYDCMPCPPFTLRYGPVQSVSSFTYTDTNEATQTISSTLYDVDTQRIPARVDIGYGDSWPTALEKVNSVCITYVAGYGNKAVDVPPPYRNALIRLCSHWYEYRDEFNCGIVDDEMTCKLVNMIAIEGRTLEYA